MASPSRTSPTMRLDLGRMRPRAQPASTIVASFTIPRSVGVSPPPQTAPAARQPFGEARRQFLRPPRVGEPGRVADGRVHGDGDGQRPRGHQVVDDGRDGVDADVAVKAPARQPQHRVGDQVLRPQPFLDVRQVLVRRLDQVGALAADAGRLAQPVGRQRRRGGGRGALAGALEGVELVVVDAAALVTQAGRAAGCAHPAVVEERGGRVKSADAGVTRTPLRVIVGSVPVTRSITEGGTDASSA